VSETEVHFGDSVRDADKKAVIELVQADMEDDLTTAGVPIRAEALELEHLRFVLERGALVLALISSWQIYESRTPHWVLITAMDEQFVFVNDPFVDRDKQESPIDSIQIPISFDTFQRISRYGRRALRAAVVLFPSAKLLPT
ncbi:MAG: peptidase C39 family protein, partial [Gammaproteobacteria bacterium]